MKRHNIVATLVLTLSLLTSSIEALAVPGVTSINSDIPTISSDITSEDIPIISVETEPSVSDNTLPSDDNEELPDSTPDIDDDTPELDGVVTSKITVTGGIEGVDYTKADDGTLTVLTSTPLVLDGGGTVIKTEQIILGVPNNACDINVTLKDLKLTKTSSTSPVKIPNNYSKDVNITFVGENELIAGDNCAAIEKNSTSKNGTLKIDGSGSLVANGGKSSAGIGGGYGFDTANIVFNDITITVTGATGIGGGKGKFVNDDYIGGNCSNITINGGNIIATGHSGAGIGGGSYGTGSSITINGGIVSATGSGCSAGIGGGYSCDGHNITISNATVTATGGDHGSGIGGGIYGNGINIKINNSSITAQGGCYGAGIGGGNSCNGNNIEINGGTITAAGGFNSDGIGGGYNGNGMKIYIKDASVKSSGQDIIEQSDGTSIYRISIPHYGEKQISYKRIDSSIWTSLTFPSFHGNDDKYYLWFPEGVYDIKAGTHEWSSLPVHGNVVSTSTKKIIIDDIVGSELEIMSENRYRVDNIEYDCSSAQDEYMIEQLSDDIFYYKHIVIGDAEKVTLKNLNLQPSDNYVALQILSITDLVLNVEGNNTFVSPSEHAGIEKNLKTGLLTISGNGNVIAKGGKWGAGIGGGKGNSTTNIVIECHTISANGGEDGAGIGGGFEGDCSNITIKGGTITATAGYDSAGIGGGSDGYGSNITIYDGNITAIGGDGGSGIGSGSGGNCNNINIYGGTVTATGGNCGSGIGGGFDGDGSNITINGGTVTATGGNCGSGIGGGEYGDGNNIIISGGNILVNSNYGIGAGNSGDKSYETTTTNIFISGGNIKTSMIGTTPKISATDNRTVSLNIFSGYMAGETIPFNSIEGAEYYNLNGIVAHDDGCFYLFLPEGVNISSPSKCLVTFVTNCDMSISSQSLYVGNKITKPIGLTKPGYILKGWYTNQYESSDTYKWDFENYTVQKDITLYALWEKGCTVTFDTGCDASVSSQTVMSGSKITKPDNPVRGGYSFTGWYKSASSRDVSYLWDFDNDTVKIDITLYAGWKEKSESDPDETLPVENPSDPDIALTPDMNGIYQYTLVLGENYRVNISGIDSQSLKSSDNKIVAVTKKGIAHGKKVGSTNVTCTVNGKTQTIHFTVVSPVICAADSYVLVGEKLEMSIKGTSIGKISWSVNNSKATINSDGVLTGVSAGKVKVTATIHNKAYNVTITVENPKFSKTSYSVKAGKSIKAKLTGTKQGMRATYSIADERIAVVTADGKIAGLIPGSTTLTATLNGKTYATQIIVE